MEPTVFIGAHNLTWLNLLFNITNIYNWFYIIIYVYNILFPLG